jgi:hypothetical protein
MDSTTTPEERKQAAAMRRGTGETSALSDLPAVILDEFAVQKYVLVASHPNSPLQQYYVRGNKRAHYHKDAASDLCRTFNTLGIPYEVLGGGRIDHTAKTIKIYGYSIGFPWKNESLHHITAHLLKQKYPLHEITFSDEGY